MHPDSTFNGRIGSVQRKNLRECRNAFARDEPSVARANVIRSIVGSLVKFSFHPWHICRVDEITWKGRGTVRLRGDVTER